MDNGDDWVMDEHFNNSPSLEERAETYSVQEELTKAQTETPITKHGKGTAPSTIDDLISLFEVTEEDVAHIKAATFLYKQVLPKGHLIAIVGKPGAGKTTVMEYVCSKIEENILYINADVSATDLPEAKRRAGVGGYKLLAPDSKSGLSIVDVVNILERISIGDEDLSDTVIIIDTLKKITPVISKHAAASSYSMLRALTGRGATVICLGHCNKYPDADGYPVYEGTSDLRSDFDELALLHGLKGDYGKVTTSLYWGEQGWDSGKSRAMVEEITWTIDVEDNRRVEVADEWVDTVVEGKEKHEAIRTADVIRDVYFVLVKSGPMNQTQMVDKLSCNHGERIIKRVLKSQVDNTWEVSKGDHNALIYTHIAGAKLPTPKAEKWGVK